MDLKETIELTKRKIEQIKRNYRFKSENNRRKLEAKLTEDLVSCAGDLGVCKSSYERAVRRQSQEIREGMQKGYPVAVQKTLLMDAAIGYMLVEDALFVLQSVATYDSITDAYALLDMAAKTITGEKVKQPKKSKRPSREEYAFLNSFETVQAKKKIVSSKGFMDMLISTGDIHKCIAAAREQNIEESASYDNVVPLEPQLEENMPSISLSPEDMKLLTQMQRSSNWSSSPSVNAPGAVGTDDSQPADPSLQNKTGDEET